MVAPTVYAIRLRLSADTARHVPTKNFKKVADYQLLF